MAQVLVDAFGGGMGEVAASAGVSDSTPGFSLLVARGEEVLFEGAFGRADLETGRMLDPRDNLLIASNTKQLACLCALILADRSLLALDEPVGEALPGLPDALARVTPLELMHHTSGVPDYTDRAYFEDEAAAHATAEEVIRRVARRGALDFAPGTSWSYSNTGYVMLGEVVCRLSGVPFGCFLEREVLRPLGMWHSFAPDDDCHRDRWQVRGYGRVGSEGKGLVGEAAPPHTCGPAKGVAWFAYPYDMRQVGYADGNVSSNVEDLLRWHAWLFDGVGPQLVSPELKRLFFGDVVLPNGRPTGYGLALFHDAPDAASYAVGEAPHAPGHHEVWHSGSTSGFVSCLGRYPDEGLSVLMLCNDEGLDRDGLYADVSAIALANG